MNHNTKWLPDVIRAFQAVGGTARFPQIYRWIRINRSPLPGAFEEAIRATVYHHSSDSPVFVKGQLNMFTKKAYGLWALRYMTEVINGKSDADITSAVLKKMAALEGFEKYVGKGNLLNQDLTNRVFEMKKRYGIE